MAERAKTMFNKLARTVQPHDETITCFRDGVVTLRKNRRVTGFTESLKEIGYQGIRKGDLVIHAMDAFAGSVGVSDSDGKGTPVYHVCTPIGKYNNYYYAYIIKEMARTNFIQSLYRGIRERSSDFRFDVFGKQQLPIPPLPEQTQIVRYLDYKVAQVNRFVRGKKREIELLKELKKAEINQAVTKGLNPNAQLKDSGIEWLGEIPEHWEVKSFRTIIKPISQKGFQDKTLLSVTREKGVIVRQLDSKEENHNYIPSDLSGYKLVQKNQFVMNKMKAWQGSYGISNFEGIVSPAYYVYSLISPIDFKYFHIAVRCNIFTFFFAKYSDGIRVGQWDLSQQKIKQIQFPIPPLAEQQQIADYLTERMAKIDSIIVDIENEIKLVQEYKTRLISDAVTGKIDVRHLAIPDTEPIEEIEEQEIEIAEDATEIGE